MTVTTTKPYNNEVAPGVLALQFNSRLRLTDGQREALRAAFNRKLAETSPDQKGYGGSIRVQTAHSSTLEAELGMDRITFSSLIGSRESHALPIILRLQRVLDVELIDRKQFDTAFRSYVKHLEENYW